MESLEWKDDDGFFPSDTIPVLQVLWWPHRLLISDTIGVEGTEEAVITAGFSCSEMLSVEDEPLSSRASFGR